MNPEPERTASRPWLAAGGLQLEPEFFKPHSVTGALRATDGSRSGDGARAITRSRMVPLNRPTPGQGIRPAMCGDNANHHANTTSTASAMAAIQFA